MDDIIVPLDHRLLTAEEVAELLRLPASTVYDLARTGRLPLFGSVGLCGSASATWRRTWPSAVADRPGLAHDHRE